MGTINLPEQGFRKHVVRMLEKLTEYFNKEIITIKIHQNNKKGQSEMKKTIIKIKNILQKSTTG